MRGTFLAAIVSLVSFSSLGIEPAAGALVAHYPLDETFGTFVLDASGNNRTGTAHGNPEWLPTGGQLGGALTLDGFNDYVETAYSANLPRWTIAVWVKSPTAPASGNPSGPIQRERNYHINWNNSRDGYRGAVVAAVGGYWYAAQFGALQADTWYHLVGSYDGENLRAYKNGLLITNNTQPSGPPASEGLTLKLGKHAESPYYFHGIIDDVRIYDTVLSDAEIMALSEPPVHQKPHTGLRDMTRSWDSTSTDGRQPMPSYVIQGQTPVFETTAVRLNGIRHAHQGYRYEGAFYVERLDKLVSPTATDTVDVTWPERSHGRPGTLPFTRLKVLTLYFASKTSYGAHPLVGDAPAPKVTSATAVSLGTTANGLPIYHLCLEAETGTIPPGEDGWISVVFETNGTEAGWVESQWDLYDDIWASSVAPGQVMQYKNTPESYPTATAALDVYGYRLAHHWKLDEGQGTVARDSIANNHGTIVDCNWTEGRFGRALFLPGPNGDVNLGGDPNLIPQHTTISSWIKPEAWNGPSGYLQVVVARTTSDYLSGALALRTYNPGQCAFIFGQNDSAAPDHVALYSSGPVAFGEWALLTATRNGREAALYINGVKDISSPYDFEVEEMDASSRLGYFHGVIDDVRIYDGALPERDVLSLYHWTPPAQMIEDFESRGFSSFNWQHGGGANWWITSSQAHSGSYSARAGQISDGESSTLTLTEACQAGEISFYLKTSTESSFDELSFRIDGVERGRWSGEQDWQQLSYPVTAGGHTFEWIYSKDGSSASGADTAWLDDVVIPLQ